MTKKIFAAVFVLSFTPALCLHAQKIITGDSIPLRGEAKYKGAWTHFDYVNPNAPKGGSITHYSIGTYDNFHRYALRGSTCEGSDYFYDTLMVEAKDEIGTLYPLIASKVEYPENYKYIILDINPNAKDQNGNPITAEDVAFSYNMFYEKGVPQFRSYYAGVTVKVLAGNRVRFDLGDKNDKEMMMDLSKTTVFPKSFWTDKEFSEPLMSPPVGTGPYRVKDYKMGQYVVLERVKDYWAKDLPVNKGIYNFDTIRYDYYRDSNVAFEAFKAGEYDFRKENSAKNWATEYTGNIFENGTMIREEIEHEIAQVTTGLIFNSQSELFSNRIIRIALNYFFDFEWMNKNLFYSQYKRTRSYFQNTEYEATGTPAKEELAILEKLRGKIPEEVFTSIYNPPVFSGDGNVRPQAREAMKLFAEAGWNLKNGKLVNADGKQMEFELLVHDVSTERYALPYQDMLKHYGIIMKIRTVDPSQFINRLRSGDFEMTSMSYPELQYPSSSLMILFHSSHIDSTWNLARIIDPAVDNLVEQIAGSQEDPKRLLHLGHALDRVLTWNHYMIPQWHLNKFRLAYKNKFVKPALRPKYDVGLDTWWVKDVSTKN
ncbi:MAG: extracellular solute-binding protein [Termitinemataceae bacterium]|nr:MAG: extracellular solute-binding protein [Termitinemataceae bacterium]